MAPEPHPGRQAGAGTAVLSRPGPPAWPPASRPSMPCSAWRSPGPAWALTASPGRGGGRIRLGRTVPAYLAAGTPAVKVLITRGPGVTWDNMYQLLLAPRLRLHPVQRDSGSASYWRLIVLPAVSPRSRCSPWPASRTGLPACPPCHSGAGAEPGLALCHGVPASLVRRDGDQPAGPVLGVPAGLGGPGPAGGRGHRLRAGRSEPARAALALTTFGLVRRGLAHSRGQVRDRGGAGLALRFRPLGLAFAVRGGPGPASRTAAADLREVLHMHALWITLYANGPVCTGAVGKAMHSSVDCICGQLKCVSGGAISQHMKPVSLPRPAGGG